jgi:hypothetical protein
MEPATAGLVARTIAATGGTTCPSPGLMEPPALPVERWESAV